MLLLTLSSLLGLSFSITYPQISQRFNVIVDQCINNVTYDGSSYDEYGSIMCHCSDYQVVCTVYEETGCDSEVSNVLQWGGCDQLSSPRYFYRVDGCAAAQTNAASGTCSYFTDGELGPTWSTYGDAIKPLAKCIDYDCGGTNSDQHSRSCMYNVDGNNITYRAFDDYYCTDLYSIDNEYAYVQKQNGGQDCSVQVTQYSLSNTNYYCGSSGSPFKVSTSDNVNKNYMLQSIDSVPIPIGECMSSRNGFHKYSEMYKCNDDIGSSVGRWIFLDSASCGGDGYLVQNYSSADYAIYCGQKTGKGKYGQYENGCYDQNYDAAYYEYPTLYGECVPFRDSPTQTDADGSLYQDVPWEQDLRIVHSCTELKGWNYETHYFFNRPDCTGDFLFRFDENSEFDSYQNLKKYQCKNSARSKISGCNNPKAKPHRVLS